jgi:hypothetical protein
MTASVSHPACCSSLSPECHRSKNYKENADGTADESSSQTGVAVVRLQAALPKARVVYASATGVTDIANMACQYDRERETGGRMSSGVMSIVSRLVLSIASTRFPVCSSRPLLMFLLVASDFTRLGLWGAGSGFSDFTTFCKSVKQRGIGAFELLSMELKNQGQSRRGQVEERGQKEFL